MATKRKASSSSAAPTVTSRVIERTPAKTQEVKAIIPPPSPGTGASGYISEALETTERLRVMEMLLDVSHRVSAIETLDEVLEVLVSITTEETGADRGSLFLNDPATNELYSRVAQGNYKREIRILNSVGVAGAAYQQGNGIIIHDAYADDRFDSSIDRETGYHTESILCAPIKTAKGEVIGVVQTLNKQGGKFTKKDLQVVEAMTTQAAITLQSRQYIERMQKTRNQEMEFLNIVSDVTSELELKPLLQRVMGEATRMLKADRSTLFLNDDKTDELWSEVGTGLNSAIIRFPNHLGIAGAVYTSSQTINIPYAYADLRFNPSFDKKTGYFTRSILCVPVVNRQGKVIGVTQVLNKQGGPFNVEDESRLKAFTAQISIGLENAKLFADIQNMKNYNESILQSMSSGVLTLDESGKIITCNASGLRILQSATDEIINRDAKDIFTGENKWILRRVEKVEKKQLPEIALDTDVDVRGNKVAVNVNVVPLISGENKRLGTMVMIEDISSEKRSKAAVARAMGSALAEKIAEQGGLKDQICKATVLFSDIRGFTTLTESLGAEGTVNLLNEYFNIMAECVEGEEGVVDKFIGDALMAGFGHVIPHDDDPDRAVRCAIAMMRKLGKLNERREMRSEEPIKIGIGLSTDKIVAGEIGSEKQAPYTMIGDGVNLAARLGSACKAYHARILISGTTFGELKGTYRVRDIDKVIVKGKTEPVGVYEVLDYHTDETYPKMAESLAVFRQGIEAYRKRKWDDAKEAFGKVLEIQPSDKLAEMYQGRCDEMKDNPPAKNWKGEWVMTSK